jgi:hypothetical protein
VLVVWAVLKFEPVCLRLAEEWVVGLCGLAVDFECKLDLDTEECEWEGAVEEEREESEGTEEAAEETVEDAPLPLPAASFEGDR